MSGTRIELEQFESGPSPMAMPADGELGAGLPDAGMGFGPGCTDDLDIGLDGADPGDDDFPMMDEPLIRPAPADTDPEADEIEVLRAELSDNCARLAGLITELDGDRDRIASTAVQAASDHVAEIGGELLNHVIRGGFLAEIAATVAELSARLPSGDAEIATAPDDHEALANLIAAAMPDGTVTLVSDPSLGPGQARMCWGDGGADFDAAQITDRVAPLIAQRLAELAPGTAP